MSQTHTDRERKKGTADLLVLTLVGEQPRHGYEIAKLIEQRSGGNLVLQVASLYPLLYRLVDLKFEGYFSDDRPARIRLDEVMWGGVRQDGIPPLRRPSMISAGRLQPVICRPMRMNPMDIMTTLAV